MISIQQIATRLGVSTATVSRALTPQYAHKVRPETRKKILALCDEVNYRPGITGRSFVTGKTYKIGIILGELQTDLGSPLFGLFMRAFCRTIQLHGYTANILYAGTSDNMADNAVEFLQSSVADAYLLGAALLNTKLEYAVRKSKCPVITLNQNRNELDGLDSIYRNLTPAYSKAWSMVSEAEAKNTAFIHGLTDNQKMQPFAEAAPQGTFFDDITLSHNFRYQDLNDFSEIYNMTDRLKQYSVLWCASDIIAFNIYKSFCAKGIEKEQMPRILGFDNAQETMQSAGKPFLSTIDPCWEILGERAAELLLDRINNKNTPTETGIDAKLILRDTF